MSHPDVELLADLATGESVGPRELDHVAACPVCSLRIRELRRTVELTQLGVAAHVEWKVPPADLLSRIESQLDADDPRPLRAVPSNLPTAPTTTPSVAVRRSRRRRDRSVLWLAGVAASGALVGLLAGRAVWPAAEPASPAAVAQVGLATLDTARLVGAARVERADGRVDLSVDLDQQSVPAVGDQGYLEVWLINKDGRRMVSVGVLDESGAQAAAPTTFPIAQSLLDAGYLIVDVSREALDDDPRHSGDSLARGTLTVT